MLKWVQNHPKKWISSNVEKLPKNDCFQRIAWCFQMAYWVENSLLYQKWPVWSKMIVKIHLVLWSKGFVFVNFHLDIEFTLFGNELKSSFNRFDSKVKWNTVFIFIGTFPCENFSWFITTRCMPVNTVVVDII